MDIHSMKKAHSLSTKLEEEIKCAQNVVDARAVFYAFDLESNIFCIAALLRGILDCIPNNENYSIKVHEISKTSGIKNVSLYFLLGRIMHYVEYMPNYMEAVDLRGVKSIRIISDWDRENKVIMRAVSLPDFLSLARKVISDVRELIDQMNNALNQQKN